MVCGDATELIPPEGRVFYLFNPFDETVMTRFAAALSRAGRPATIVYYNAKFLEPFRTGFTVQELNDPALAHRVGGDDAGLSPVRRRRHTITPQASAKATEETSTAPPPR